MQYLLILADDETQQLKPGDPGFPEQIAAYVAFTERVRAKGAFVAAGRLRPTASATTVRVRGGKTLTTDGPFAETKEQMGGFYLLECTDLDEALAFAAEVPTARRGSVEVRPLF